MLSESARRLLFATALLAGCAAGPPRDAPRDPPVTAATWDLVRDATRSASVTAAEEASAGARSDVAQWVTRVRARTDTEFVPWATSYWTHQWLALKLAWYRRDDTSGDGDGDTDATQRLVAYLQDKYRDSVLEPVARETHPRQIAEQAATRYARALATRLDAVAAGYAVPRAALDEWLAGVPAIEVPPGASLRDVVRSDDLGGLAAYRSLVAEACGDAGATGLAGHGEALHAVAQCTASRLSTVLAVRGGAAAASLLGGVPGLVVGAGLAAWDAADYERQRPALEAALRADLDEALSSVHRELLQDPEHGVLVPLAHIAATVAAALGDGPAEPPPAADDELF